MEREVEAEAAAKAEEAVALLKLLVVARTEKVAVRGVLIER